MPRTRTEPPVEIEVTPYGTERLYVASSLVLRHPQAHEALLEWCRQHGLVPEEMPMSDVIEVHPATREITYTRFDGPGLATRTQLTIKLDRPIAAWPASIKELA